MRISNTGPATPADRIPRLLQPFQRLHTQRRADETGLGLGLGLGVVAAVAKAHRATLTALPGSHGGLDITITFPPAALTTA